MAPKTTSTSKKKSKRKRKKHKKCPQCRRVKRRRHQCPEFKCTHCNAVYHRKDRLQRHIDRKHSANQHQCDQCDQQFVSSEYLAQHKLTHITKRCRICNQTMSARSFKGHQCRPKWTKLPTNVIVEINQQITQHIDQSECGIINTLDALKIINAVTTNHDIHLFPLSRSAEGKLKDSGRRAVRRFLRDHNHSFQRRDSLKKRLPTPPPLTPLQILVRYAENQPERVYASSSQEQRDALLSTLTLKTTSREYEEAGRRRRKTGKSNRGMDFSSDVMYIEKYDELRAARSSGGVISKEQSADEIESESDSEPIAFRTRNRNRKR